MFKKRIFKKLEKRYRSHAYSGLLGVLMNYCHRKLENFSKKKNHYDKILEIGAGSAPHFKYIKETYNEYHIAETSKLTSRIYNKKNKIKIINYDGKKLPYKNKTFDRIIISPCLEHILSPEEFISEMYSKLKKGGVLSISLPTDPGIFWRLGRTFLKIFTINSTYKISTDEFNYLNATEHVNSIFNLISIIRFNYKKKIEEGFYPFKIQSIDLNLFYNVHIYK